MDQLIQKCTQGLGYPDPAKADTGATHEDGQGWGAGISHKHRAFRWLIIEDAPSARCLRAIWTGPSTSATTTRTTHRIWFARLTGRRNAKENKGTAPSSKPQKGYRDPEEVARKAPPPAELPPKSSLTQAKGGLEVKPKSKTAPRKKNHLGRGGGLLYVQLRGGQPREDFGPGEDGAGTQSSNRRRKTCPFWQQVYERIVAKKWKKPGSAL